MAKVELDRPAATLTWTDDAPLQGTSYYYLGIEPRDGGMAWASPIWVTPAGDRDS